MTDQAKVTSVEALEAFRSSLLVFLSKARPTLEEVSSEVVHTRLWLQNDQRAYWERQKKIRARELEEAKAELFSARLSKFQQASAAQQMAVQKAQRSLNEAEEKLRLLKKWDRELENRSEPMVKMVEQLHGFLGTDMVRAAAYLTETIKILEAYAEVGPRPGSGGPTPVPAATDSAGDAASKADASSAETGSTSKP
jgi:hypothetical protein